MKVITPKEAAALINDNDQILIVAFSLAGLAEEVLDSIEERFLAEGHPRNIGSIHAAGAGNFSASDERGEGALAHEGLLGRFVGSHAGSSPKILKFISENKCPAWNLPLGAMLQTYKEIGKRGLGLLTKTGLGTFIDPRYGGGKVNQMARDIPDEYVELQIINGEEWLLYKSFHVDVGLMRGTTADLNGNISIEKESINLEHLAVAQAAKACGGITIVQVESLTQTYTIHPKMVKVPGIYVDYVVVAEKPDRIMQTSITKYNRSFTGEIVVPVDKVTPVPLDEAKAITRRAAMEFSAGYKCNFGIGMPTITASVVAEEGCSDLITMISESGNIGGVPGAGANFGSHWNVQASCDQGDHFTFFDGGGLDSGTFGLSEVDKNGNVNTSLLNGKIMGVGGFINVSTHAHLAMFVGTFTAGGIEIKIEDGKVIIVNEGKYKKFVNNIVQLTYNADLAVEKGHKILFITERCVIERTAEGMVLKEIAPGIDLQTQILDKMEFRPIIPEGGPVLMNPDIFRPEWGGLKSIIEKNAAKKH